jgi:hypothetical protein
LHFNKTNGQMWCLKVKSNTKMGMEGVSSRDEVVSNKNNSGKSYWYSFFTLVYDCFLIARWFSISIWMFLFRAFDTYVVKLLEGHPKDGRRKLKYHTTFCVQQQPPDNTYGFYVCLNTIAFEVQPNCSVSVSAFILFYYWCLWLNMHIHLLLIHTSHFIVAGLWKCFH